jgi:hypothetical protein
MGHTEDLLEGLAQMGATASLWLYQTAGYASTDTGAGIGMLPRDCDKAVSITDYLSANDSPNQALGTIGVQFWFRGLPYDRASMTNLRDAAFQLFQGMTNRDFGTCHVIQMRRVSSVPQGPDGNNRFEQADNYYLDINTPVTANRNQ